MKIISRADCSTVSGATPSERIDPFAVAASAVVGGMLGSTFSFVMRYDDPFRTTCSVLGFSAFGAVVGASMPWTELYFVANF